MNNNVWIPDEHKPRSHWRFTCDVGTYQLGTRKNRLHGKLAWALWKVEIIKYRSNEGINSEENIYHKIADGIRFEGGVKALQEKVYREYIEQQLKLKYLEGL